MSELILIHRARNGNALELGVPTWSTCLRQIAFMHSKDFSGLEKDLLGTDEVYKSDAAFAFLLEVVCGLKSPLLGETEVQGQFKLFLAETSVKHEDFWGFFASFFQGILSESKHVRTNHLKNLGSQSYGSLIRRRLKGDESVSILGAGQLTGQILPWLKSAKNIHVHARSPDRAEALRAGFPQVEVKIWNEVPLSEVLVVAAPISNSELIQILQKRNAGSLIKLIDLRGEAALNLSQLMGLGLDASNYESLSELMKEINHDQIKISERVTEAKNSIRKCGEAFMNRVIFRPGGWEDLCG